MKLWKKGMAVVSATVLAASLPLYSEAAGNVTLTGKVWPKSGISLNFNGVEFNGTVGEAAAKVVHKLDGVDVTAPEITVRYKDNYNVNVISDSFTGTASGATPINLDPSRIKVNDVSLGLNPTNILSASGMGNAAQIEIKDLNFSLNLTESGFTDSTEISKLSSEANLEGTITISFNSL